MPLSITSATFDDAGTIAALQTRVAEDLTRRHGVGHWSAPVTEQNVARGIASSTVLIGRDEGVIVGTLRLVTKKPWAIDPAYFAAVRRPLYLLSMAVEPARQRTGIGTRLLAEARVVGAEWPADAIRLDAYRQRRRRRLVLCEVRIPGGRAGDVSQRAAPLFRAPAMIGRHWPPR